VEKSEFKPGQLSSRGPPASLPSQETSSLHTEPCHPAKAEEGVWGTGLVVTWGFPGSILHPREGEAALPTQETWNETQCSQLPVTLPPGHTLR
jgi:hypothetical protein